MHTQLAQLASMTVLSIDTGDLDIVEQFAATGYITDATTNPLFVSQAGLSGDPRSLLLYIDLFCFIWVSFAVYGSLL